MKKLFLAISILISLNAFSQLQWFQLNGREKQQYYADSFYTVSSYSSLGSLRMLVKDTLTNKVFHTSIPSTSITADNGLTASTSTNVQLGGTLLQNTSIDVTSAYYLAITGTNSSADGAFQVSNAGNGIYVNVSGSNHTGIQSSSAAGIAMQATSTGGAFPALNVLQQGTGIGANIFTSSGVPIRAETQPSSTATIVPTLQLWRNSTGTPANGVGQSIDFLTNTTVGLDNSNQLISKWTTATDATRTSQFIITGVNSAVTGDIAYFNGNGMVGIGSATASATRLNVVDNSVGDADMVTLSSTSTSSSTSAQKLLNVSLSGANSNSFQTTYAGYFVNTHTGTAAFNRGIYGEADGSGSVAGFFSSTSGTGVYGLSTGGSYGIEAVATTGAGIFAHSDNGGNGVSAQSIEGIAIIATSIMAATNTVVPIVQITRSVSGTAADGIGGSIEFVSRVSDGTNQLSNQLISKFTNATVGTRTSQFKITGVLSTSTVDVFTANADGSWQIRPITATAASAITPAEGMIVFVSSTNGTFVSIGLWSYQNGAWHAL